jgi:hypothetical protein
MTRVIDTICFGWLYVQQARHPFPAGIGGILRKRGGMGGELFATVGKIPRWLKGDGTGWIYDRGHRRIAGWTAIVREHGEIP